MPKLTIVKGLPGSGKTTLALKLTKEKNGVAVAADDFFTHEDGSYKWSGKLIKAAHEWCLGVSFYHLSRGKDVFVHNVFAQKWTAEKFIDFAHENGYDWDIIEPTTKWKFDVPELAKRNTHGLSEAMIQKIHDSWEPTKDILKAFEKYRAE